MLYYGHNIIRGFTMKKYLILFGLLVLVPVVANAEVSVKDTTSPEFIKNQGYSSEVSRLIEIKTKDPATPITKEETSRMKKLGHYLLNVIDPAYEKKNTFGDHNIRYSPTIDDL